MRQREMLITGVPVVHCLTPTVGWSDGAGLGPCQDQAAGKEHSDDGSGKETG